MIVSRLNDSEFIVGCNDRALLDSMQGILDGSKIYNKNQIRIPYKSSPKIARFESYGIDWRDDTKATAVAVSNNIKSRKLVVADQKRQYISNNIVFDYNVRGVYPPLKHQKTMFNVMTTNNVAGILAEPGTCKTGAYLWAIDKRIQRGEVKRALVITLAPLKDNVIEEMKVQVPHMSGVTLHGGKARCSKILHKEFKIAKHNNDYDIYVANYESMVGISEVFLDDYFDMVILDEAHRIGSPTSNQTKAIVD